MTSIIIPVYNQHQMTKDCIAAVMENTLDYELIIVDNGSEPPITESSYYKIVRNNKNLGFPVAVNQGIKASRGDTIILLNNDVIVTPGWKDRLLSNLTQKVPYQAGYAIIGPATSFAAGIQQISLPAYQDYEEMCIESAKWASEHVNQVQPVRWIIGFCMAFQRSLIDAIGFFDETLWPCCGEEIDFCMRANKKGFKVGIQVDAYVHHYGSKTFTELNNAGTIDYSEICYRNENHLEKLWGDVWHSQTLSSNDLVVGVPSVKAAELIKIDLGCGFQKPDGYIGIDNRPETNADIVGDVMDGLPFDDNSVDVVRAHDFLEHIPIGKVVPVMNDIWRVLKPGGVLDASTPSTDGRGAFQDPTHVSFWNRNSWIYYSEKEMRDLYGIKADFYIESLVDTVPDSQYNVIHTKVMAKAVK